MFCETAYAFGMLRRAGGCSEHPLEDSRCLLSEFGGGALPCAARTVGAVAGYVPPH